MEIPYPNCLKIQQQNLYVRHDLWNDSLEFYLNFMS